MPDAERLELGNARQIAQSLPGLKLVDERTGGLFGQELSQTFHGDFEISASPIAVRQCSALIDSLESPGCHNLIGLEALGGNGLLVIENGLLFALLERLFGGSGLPPSEDSVAFDRARFSSIEERVIRRVVRMYGRSMESAWRAMLPLTIRHVRVETKPRNAPIAGPDDNVSVTSYTIKADGSVMGTIHFALPVALLEVRREELSWGGFDEKRGAEPAWRAELAASFQRIGLQVVAELGRAQLTLGDFLELEVGSVIRLHQAPERPVAVSIEGIEKFRGFPTVLHGNLAVEVVSPGNEVEVIGN